jgi:hypothetical protein
MEGRLAASDVGARGGGAVHCRPSDVFAANAISHSNCSPVVPDCAARVVEGALDPPHAATFLALARRDNFERRPSAAAAIMSIPARRSLLLFDSGRRTTTRRGETVSRAVRAPLFAIMCLSTTLQGGRKGVCYGKTPSPSSCLSNGGTIAVDAM